MMFKKYLCLAVLIMIFSFFPSLQAEEETKYVFAFPPHSLLGLSSTEIMGLLKPMTDHLGKELGSPMELRAVTDYQVFLKDFGKGKIDIAIADIPLYLKARKDFGVIPLMRFDKTYRGILVTSAASNIQKIERARGKTLACCSRYSMASYFFPRSLLAEKHLGEIESFFRSIKITGKDSQSLQSLITGEVDIASVTEPTYFIMVKRLPVLGTLLKVVEKSSGYPYGPIFVRNGMSEEKMELIKNLLMNFELKPEQKKAIKLYFPIEKIPLKLVTAKDEDYASFSNVILE